jgi:hypothetical protein
MMLLAIIPPLFMLTIFVPVFVSGHHDEKRRKVRRAQFVALQAFKAGQ